MKYFFEKVQEEGCCNNPDYTIDVVEGGRIGLYQGATMIKSVGLSKYYHTFDDIMQTLFPNAAEIDKVLKVTAEATDSINAHFHSNKYLPNSKFKE